MDINAAQLGFPERRVSDEKVRNGLGCGRDAWAELGDGPRFGGSTRVWSSSWWLRSCPGRRINSWSVDRRFGVQRLRIRPRLLRLWPGVLWWVRSCGVLRRLRLRPRLPLPKGGPSRVRVLRRSAIPPRLSPQVAPPPALVTSATTAIQRSLPAVICARRGGGLVERMKDFSNASFSPE